MAPQIGKRDLKWVVLIVLSFAFALAFSWERWGNLLVDCGREMNQPLRLARGEMLYSDVRHIYGPLSPYLNAALYKLFGPSLTVLYANGIATAALILALVYWLARQLMSCAPSAAATLSVMCLCAFKPSGNYVLPYSYSALHGCALGLASLALVVAFVKRSPGGAKNERVSNRRAACCLLAAGAIAGLSLLAKTEMGLAAIITGVAAAGLVGYPSARRSMRLAMIFSAPAVVITAAVYAYFASRVGIDVLSQESFLFLRNLPPELVYFNKRVSGFDAPMESIIQILGAAFRIAALALAIAAVSHLFARSEKSREQAQPAVSEKAVADKAVADAGRAAYSQLWVLAVASALLLASIPVFSRMQWDKGPYLAMPLLLVGLLIWGLIGYQKQFSGAGEKNQKTIILIVLAVYALASLARVMLRVRSGGAYSSYLLPASVIVFTYVWSCSLVSLIRNPKARRIARSIAIGLILVDVAGTAGLLAYRYRTKNTHPVVTERGAIITLADLGAAFNEAIHFIHSETAPGEPVAVMPEGTSLNFLTDRPNPLREEITTPGFLDDEGEARAIGQLKDSNTRLILIANRATSEFGPTVFGRDYCNRLMQWVEENFDQVAIFGQDKDSGLEIGDKTFFIRAYMKKGAQASSEPLAKTD